jgi:acyl carrier protein
MMDDNQSYSQPGEIGTDNAGCVDRISIRKRIVALVDKNGLTDHPIAGTGLNHELDLDSIGLVQLILLVEQEFAIEVDDADLDLASFRTVNGIVEYIHNRLSTTQVD